MDPDGCDMLLALELVAAPGKTERPPLQEGGQVRICV